MMKNLFSKIKLLFVLCAVCLCGLIGGAFALQDNAAVNADAATAGNVTQVQFRMNGEETQNFFFLRMADQTDYTTGNALQQVSFVENTNLLDKVTVYFTDGCAKLRDVWDGKIIYTYLWGDNHTLAFLMNENYVAYNGVGARIEEGSEIPLLSGEKIVTATTRTFWDVHLGSNRAIDRYMEGYEEIPVTVAKTHIRANNDALEGLQFLVGLGEGNDWNGKGSALATEVKGADNTNSHVLEGHWRKLLTTNFLSKIKLHVQATDTWVTLGKALTYNDAAPQLTYIYNNWGETGGTLNVVLNAAYNASTIDKIVFEAGCELPTYYTTGHADVLKVHVLDAQYVWTNPDMSLNYWGIFGNTEKKYQVTFNGANAVLLDTNGAAVAFPTELSETKAEDAYASYVYNWFLNGELYDFSTPVTGNINLTSDGTFTAIPKEYKVTYYALDGKTVLYEDVYNYGEMIEFREINELVGYENCSWNYNGVGEIPTTMPSEDISFTVQGTPKSYVLTFANGDESMGSINVTYATAILDMPVAPAKVGYDAYWTVDGEEITEETIWLIDGDKTAVPGYTAKKYVLTFVNNEETVTTLEVTYDEAIGDLPATPQKENHVTSWAVDGAVITAETIWNYAEDKTAEPVYELKKITVTFDGENGVDYPYGSTIEKPANPTKESTKEYDFVFDGWYNGETKWDFEKDTLTEKTNLVSKYTQAKRKYTVSFNITGRDDITLEAAQVEYGSNYDLMNLFTDEEVEGYLYSVTVNGADKANIKVVADVVVDIAFTEAPVAEPVEKGCAGSISGMSAMFVGMMAMGFAIFAKKKED